MINMKKISALAFSCILVFSMTACSSSDNPEDILKDANAKQEKLTSSNVKGSMTMKMDSKALEGLDQNLNMNYTAQISDMNKDSMKMAMESNVDFLGSKVATKIYYTDGYTYTEASGQKTKVKSDLATIKKQVAQTLGQSYDINTKYCKDLEVKEDGDNKIVSYKISDDGVDDFLSSMMSQLSSLTGNSSADNVKISNVSGKKTVDADNNTLEDDIKMTITTKVSSEDIKMEISTKAQYTNPGKSVTVKLPSDLKKYKETTAATTATTENN